jgi:hypothetical protein
VLRLGAELVVLVIYFAWLSSSCGLPGSVAFHVIYKDMCLDDVVVQQKISVLAVPVVFYAFLGFLTV